MIATVTQQLNSLPENLSPPLLGYLGPGGGLSAIGSMLALMAAVVVALFGFVWFPLKRLLRSRKPRSPLPEETETTATETAAPK